MADFRVHFDWNGNRHIITIAANTPDAAASIITKRYPGAIVSKTKRDKSINGRKASVIVNDEWYEKQSKLYTKEDFRREYMNEPLTPEQYEKERLKAYEIVFASPKEREEMEKLDWVPIKGVTVNHR